MENKSKNYELNFTEQFLEDIEAHKRAGQRVVIEKISSLINELREHPYSGTGKPEQLRGDRKGQWSRRITQKHRLIYEIHEDRICVLLVSGSGHYGDK
ncbi:MAG: Txe/YoeB family addiction module toxin [Tannerellaceae bacterium]